MRKNGNTYRMPKTFAGGAERFGGEPAEEELYAHASRCRRFV